MNALLSQLGELLIIGLPGTHLTQGNSRKLLTQIKPGGVILFGKNCESAHQTSKLIVDCKSLCDRPLWMSVDQEGGTVQRLTHDKGFTESPAPYSLAHDVPPSDIIRAIDTMAKALIALGFNVNYFPTVDLASNPENPIIAKLDRAFSASPYEVTRYAELFVSRFAHFRLASCLKHFPGHGSSTEDSHLALPDISDSWRRDELIPYRSLFATHDIPFVMLGHLFHQGFDHKAPTSLSPVTTTTLLRQKLNYQGIIVTDDLQMAAISGSLEDAVINALNAGSDQLLFGNNIGEYQPTLAFEVINIIDKALRAGHLDPVRCEQSIARSRHYKKVYCQ